MPSNNSKYSQEPIRNPAPLLRAASPAKTSPARTSPAPTTTVIEVKDEGAILVVSGDAPQYEGPHNF